MAKKMVKPTWILDTDRTDEAVLALMWLGFHDGSGRTWKGFDWRALERLHAKGFISDPVGKAKSVVLSEEGEARSRALFEAMFTKPADDDNV